MDNIFQIQIIVLVAIVSVIFNKIPVSNKYKIAINIILIFEGLSIIFLANKVPWLFGFIPLIVGSYFLYSFLHFSSNLNFIKIEKSMGLGILDSLSSVSPYFLHLGLIILSLNIFLNKVYLSSNFGGLDSLIIFFALNLILYDKIPNKFQYEKNFTFIFSSFLIIFYVIPTVVTNNPFNQSDEESNSLLVRLLLSIPLEVSLNLLGVKSQAIYNDLHFLSRDGELYVVSVARGCSGIYSLVIFISAFFSYVLLHYTHFDRDLILFLSLGIFISYLSNLLRMNLVVLAGHYYGMEALLFVHSHLGWLLFSLWMLTFWFILDKYIPSNINDKKTN